MALWGPTGPGGGAPLTGFAGVSNTSGNYTITLTGAQTIAAPAASVPEPSVVMGVLALAGIGFVARTRNAITELTKR
ncbi:PEP-CTERM sorting domain-containing protein [Halomicronema hongdechloris]|uniref:PEP-CTERM sorting domain-containing protein n=1 Tax=Halomicronema hongdechloris TaxID=1209493 RepID=UPI0010CB585E